MRSRLCFLLLLISLAPYAGAQQGAGAAGARGGRIYSKQPAGGPVTKPKEFFRKPQKGPFAKGEVYVRFRAEAAPAQRQAAHAAARMGRIDKSYGKLLPDTVRVIVPAGKEQEVVNAYLDDPNVVYAKPVYLSKPLATPNDTRMGDLQGMDEIRARDAWDVSTGDPNFLIGIVDTGLNFTHSDLAANVWTNPNEIAGNGIDDDGNYLVDDVHGYDFRNYEGDITDSGPTFHGTHVAGIIGAVGNNAAGVVGVNWRCKIVMAACADPTDGGNLVRTVDALSYLLQRGVEVSNHSYGSPSYSQTEFDMFAFAGVEYGHIAVCAAGNDGADNDSAPQYPASYALDNIISVANHRSTGELYSSSNYGATSVDLAAPGSFILSTTGLPDTLGYYIGTSMSAPHVTGTIALVWSSFPYLT